MKNPSKSNELKAMLVLHGISHRQIADVMGVTDSAVTHVVKGSYRSKRIENYICKLLNVPHSRFFGK